MTTLDIHSPLQDAVRQMAARTVVGSPMTSREWELLPAEVRLRAMFSARVEHERTLAEMQDRIVDGIANAKRDGATMDRARFVAEMSEMIKSNGYKRPDGVNRKSVQNLRSRARLELIWNMNVAQARGYAKWLADMTPEGLENEPCYELVRIMPRQEHRDWPLVWADHGGQFYGTPGEDYPNAPGRMIAKKTDAIWRWISRFKTPWPPFDWGSGMGLAGIDIDEAEALGVIGPDEAPKAPLAAPTAAAAAGAAGGFNANYSMSAKGIPESGRESLRSAFGDSIKFDNDRIVLQRHLTPETDEQRKQPITESLQQRARKIADAGRDHFSRARSEDVSAAYPSSFDTGELADEILAHTAAVAVGRKLLYHDEWTRFAENIATLIREFLPPEVEVFVLDGHVYAFRPDVVGMTAEEIHGQILEGNMGRLLGYGQNMLDEPAVLVRLAKDDGTLVSGFLAAPQSAITYGRARAKDWADAHGWNMRVIIAGKEVRP